MANGLGGYFGVEAMEGEKGLDIRKLFEGLKKKQKAFQEGQAKRKKWGGISDLFETAVGFIPGIGKFAKPILDVLSEQVIQKQIGLEGGPDLRGLETMWTGGEGKATQEEFEKMYEASDVSLGQGLIREATDFMGSELGGEFMGKAWEGAGDLFSGFGGGEKPTLFGKEFSRKHFYPTMDKVELSPLAEKFTEDPTSALKMLSAGENIQLDDVTGRPDLNFDYLSQISEVDAPLHQIPTMGSEFITKMPTEDLLEPTMGRQWSSNPPTHGWTDEGEWEKYTASTQFPWWDKEEGFHQKKRTFEQGGQVPEYRGGGTIVDYFGSKGVTLGGSNTESLASRLGKK